MTKAPPTEVFLSYATKDRGWAAQFAQSLRATGVHAWFDVDEVAPGERWQEKSLEALRESRVLVLLISAHSLENSKGFFDVGAAVADKKRIIPVLLEDAASSALPKFLRQFQFVSGQSPAEAARRVAEVVEHSSADR